MQRKDTLFFFPSNYYCFFPLPVHFAAQRRGTVVSGPGPPLPPFLLILALLPATQEWRLLALPFAHAAAQRRLLLHRLVRHHRHACLQVRRHTESGHVSTFMIMSHVCESVSELKPLSEATQCIYNKVTET